MRAGRRESRVSRAPAALLARQFSSSPAAHDKQHVLSTAASCGKVTDTLDTRGVYPERILRRPEGKWRGIRVNTTGAPWGAIECPFCRVPGHTMA